jgi:hypothetical protein
MAGGVHGNRIATGSVMLLGIGVISLCLFLDALNIIQGWNLGWGIIILCWVGKHEPPAAARHIATIVLPDKIG